MSKNFLTSLVLISALFASSASFASSTPMDLQRGPSVHDHLTSREWNVWETGHLLSLNEYQLDDKFTAGIQIDHVVANNRGMPLSWIKQPNSEMIYLVQVFYRTEDGKSHIASFDNQSPSTHHHDGDVSSHCFTREGVYIEFNQNVLTTFSLNHPGCSAAE